MRKQLLILFTCFVTIPIIIIYSVAAAIFNERTELNLKNIYTSDIRSIARIAENYFSESLDLTMYPLLENNLYKFFQTPADNEQFSQITENATTVLTSSPYVFGGIRGVIMLRNDGIQIATHSNYISNSSITDYEREQADLLNGECFWEFQKNHSISLFTITRRIKSKSNLNMPLGYVQTSVSSHELINTIQNAVIEKNSIYFILDETNQVILSTDKQYDYTGLLQKYDFKTLSLLASKQTCTTLDGDHFISAQKIGNTPYIIASIINPDVFTATKATLINILTGISVFTVFFFLLLAFIFSRHIVRPLQELGNKMQSISDENFSVRAQVEGNNEITMLAGQFNKMGERLEYLYRQVYMRELELKKSQLMALQSQVNPHFLYNTMDTIYWMSEMGNTQDISRIVSSMSKLLRLTFVPDDNDTVSLSEELSHLTYYMEIQKIRYGDSIEFDLQCPEDFGSLLVLRLLLQPLVENALVHGLKEHPREKITVRIYRQETFLIYRIMNNGTPLDLPLIQGLLTAKTTERKGFAIRNIDKRLKLKYGDDYGLEYGIEDDFNFFQIKQPVF